MPEQNEIITALQDLMEKSIKANAEFLQQSGKIFTGLLSQKLEAKDIVEMNNKVLADAMNNFIKMNIQHSQNLMDFGVNVSRNIVSFIENKNAGHNTETKNDQQANQNGNGQINLSAKQGQQISTSFYLNSHNAFSQTGKFISNDFTDASGKNAVIKMSISPSQFTLEPGKSVKVDISITLPENISAGKYRSTVHLEGMDTQDFDIVVDVAENSAAPAWIEDKTPKASKKKTTPRGKSKK